MQLKINPNDIKDIVEFINNYDKKTIKIMEVCGTHTMAIAKSGIKTILPENIKLISGPGCPVCVTAINRIDEVLALSQNPKVLIATFGDMFKVPGSRPGVNLASLKSMGAKIEMIYSAMDALLIAENNPEYEVVFLGIGFETTAPGTAVAIKEAKERNIKNFSVFSMHKFVEPALRVLLDSKEIEIDAFICPGHVSTILGIKGFKFLADEYKKPSVISGFEPEDILTAIYKIIMQIEKNTAIVENEYLRIVNLDGNKFAQKFIEDVFEPVDDVWRGLGVIPRSGMGIKDIYSDFDTVKRFDIKLNFEDKVTICKCGDIIKGKIEPKECSLFAKICSPENPIGPCMVSSEGACAAYYKYLRF
ncbi:MAG: hydrogenase formation protein HypD [Caloramator sp.]|nr:hydrogenase formation protein HypD [Caloramator sp.]